MFHCDLPATLYVKNLNLSIILKLCTIQQYGFIEGDQVGRIFFHFSCLDKGSRNQVHVGDKLKFYIEKTKDGKLKAVDISKVSDSSVDSSKQVIQPSKIVERAIGKCVKINHGRVSSKSFESTCRESNRLSHICGFAVSRTVYDKVMCRITDSSNMVDMFFSISPTSGKRAKNRAQFLWATCLNFARGEIRLDGAALWMSGECLQNLERLVRSAIVVTLRRETASQRSTGRAVAS